MRRASSSVRGRPQKAEPRYDDCAIKTQERLGREFNLSPSTIWKYRIFSVAIDNIYEISEELALEILKGVIKISQENIIAISKTNEREIQNMADYLMHEKTDYGTFARSRNLVSKSFAERTEENVSVKQTSIKDMPEYDPDAEVISLALTIPSWISFMKRIFNANDMSKISNSAKSKLRNELNKLDDAIFDFFNVLKEEK